jgi:teichuronic acid biosynthesis glycosyltransferase TuaG
MSLHDELISIITPAYNSSRFIEQTIESVQYQTYVNWEMIIIDDCSHDDTVKRIQAYAALDHRIHVIEQNNNCGPATTRNKALKAAKGRYVAFLDSDDLWLPEKLDQQLDFMQRHDFAFTYTCYRRISENNDSCGRIIAVPPKLNYSQLLRNTAIATSTVLINRDKTGQFEMTRTYYDDYALWLMLLRRGLTAYGLQKDLMRYRIVRKSVSRHKLNSAKWVWRTYRDVEGLAFPYAAWCFLNYAWRAWCKYAVF